MVKRLQIILVLVLAALLASPVAGGFASSVVSHGVVAYDHGHDHDHDHDANVLSDDVTQNDAGQTDGHGKNHHASDHVPGNVLPVQVHDQLSISPVMSGSTLKASKAFDEQPLERPPRLIALA